MTYRSPPPTRTGVSGQYQATLGPEQVPGAVALLMQERTAGYEWREKHSGRLHDAEKSLKELQAQDHAYERLRADDRVLRVDDQLVVEKRFADIILRIAKAETSVKAFLVTVGSVWTIVTVLIGLWLAYAR